MSQSDEYKRQAELLLKLTGKTHPQYSDIWGLKTRLERKLHDLQIHGPSPQHESDLTGILLSLNEISMKLFEATFDELSESSVTVKPQEKVQTIPPQPPPASKKDGLIFISHTTQNDDFVARLADDLIRVGFDVWHDGKDIKVSQSIPAAINKGLAGCDYFIIVLTPESVASHWVLQELDAALARKKVILPILLKNCECPVLIQANKYADFRSDYQSGLNELLDTPGIRQAMMPKTDFENVIPATHPPELTFIFSVTERMCYNHDLSPEQGQTLRKLYREVAIKKQKGEKLMPPLDLNNTGEMFLYSTKILAYDLVSLTEHYAEWPDLIVSDRFKKQSVELLKKMHQQVLVSSALVEQVCKQSCSQEIDQILTPLNSLQKLLKNIDDFLLSGQVPFHVKSEIEKNFDDLTYHLNRYLLILNELSSTPRGNQLLQ